MTYHQYELPSYQPSPHAAERSGVPSGPECLFSNRPQARQAASRAFRILFLLVLLELNQ